MLSPDLDLTPAGKHQPANALTDDELFDELREQVTLARNTRGGHNRERTREIADEARNRGWSLGRP